MRMRGFALDLTNVDAALLAAWAEPTAPFDVSIAAVSPGEAGDARFWVELAGLHDAAREGWPDPDPGGPADSIVPADLRVMLRPPGETPLAFFIARHRDQCVGYSVLARRRSPGEAQFAATAVRPEYRGRGVATALRARCLAAARDAGCSSVRSASGSDALIRINARFGFAETYCEVRLVKRLSRAG
jgi:GNAT superfamily N-acetyltransferase